MFSRLSVGKAVAGLVAAIVMVACSAPGARPSSSSASPPGSPSQSQNSTSRPATGAGLPNCQLAVSWRIFDQSTRQWSSTRAGFIRLPEGTLTEDPAGTAAAAVRSQVFYDLAARKWVPVRREAVSPDGSQFAFVDSASGLHLVTVSSGNDRLLLADGGWAIVEFGSDALYLAKAEPVQSVFAGSGIALKGLYREPLTGGPPRRLLSSDVAYFTIAKGHGWALLLQDFDARPRQLVRIDLQSGASDVWYTAPESGIGQLAVDTTGSPIVSLPGGGALQLMRVEAKDTTRTLFESPDKAQPQGGYAVDSAGLWLSTFTPAEPFSSPPWLLDTAGQLHRLPSVAPNSVEVAGGCH
jgi:hypothetical protein